MTIQLVVLLVLLLPFAGCKFSIPNPTPKPPASCPAGQHLDAGKCVPDPQLPDEEPLPGIEWARPGIVCTQPGEPRLKHNPTQDPKHAELLPVCPADPAEPPKPPAGAGCVLTGEPSTQLEAARNTLGEKLNAAMHALKPGCEVGGDCVINEYTLQGWAAAVNAEMRRLGVCAGQHTPGVTDEIALADKASDPWQGFHVGQGDDSEVLPKPPGTPNRKVVWSPQAFRGAWLPPEGQAPAPEPERPGSACPGAPCPPLTYEDGRPHQRIDLEDKPNGWKDPTPKQEWDWDYCLSIGMGYMGDPALDQRRSTCPFRNEGPGGVIAGLKDERKVIEEWWLGLPGAPSPPFWEARGGELEVDEGNPWRARCQGEACEVRACTRDRRVCSLWRP